MARKADKGRREGVTWAQAVRDILIASMNKGQAPLFLCFAVVGLMLWRMPPEDVSRLVFETIGRFEHRCLWGWIVAFLMFLGWISHVKIQRQIIVQEMRRLGGERTDRQKEKLGDRVKSSDERS